MDNSLLVGRVQCVGHRRHQFHSFIKQQPGVLQRRGEIGAINELRDDEAGELLGASDIMHRHDVRVVEGGDRAGFGQVGFGVLRVSNQPGVRLEQVIRSASALNLTNVALPLTPGSAPLAIVPVTDRVAEKRVPLAGVLRGIEFNKDDATLAEIVKN